jgi:hypothetical protein
MILAAITRGFHRKIVHNESGATQFSGGIDKRLIYYNQGSILLNILLAYNEILRATAAFSPAMHF